MMSSFKKFFFLTIALTLFSSTGAFAAKGFTCTLTLAPSGTSLDESLGTIMLKGYEGEKISGRDESTRFRYKIEVMDGEGVYCREGRRQALVSLYHKNDNKAFIVASTCFIPNEDFYIGSAAADHWLYFNCYANRN